MTLDYSVVKKPQYKIDTVDLFLKVQLIPLLGSAAGNAPAFIYLAYSYRAVGGLC